MDAQAVAEFNENGAYVVPSVLKTSVVSALHSELTDAIEQDSLTYSDVFDVGMVHNCHMRGDKMLALLDDDIFNSWTTFLLHRSCIMYAYQSSSLAPGVGNFGSRIHVDCPRYIPDYITNLGIIFPLDDFTEQNGATHYLPGSHLYEELPSETEFHGNSKRIVAKAGDMIIFNGRLVHAAGTNQTNIHRHSLTINLCRHFMRQRFDYPRMLTERELTRMGPDARRLLGMNVRIPATLEEFYLPEEDRLYKGGQE